MHIGHYLTSSLGWILVIAGLVVIGAVFSRRAGAGSTRMWWGLGLLMVLQALSLAWSYLLPQIAYRGRLSISTLSLGYGLVNGAIFLAAVALLASAATIGRGPQYTGYLDPTRPGAPPTGYDGTGYPPPSGRSPYETPGGDGVR